MNPGYTGKRFPHVYKNEDRDSKGNPLFPETGKPYYEYVSKSYPYEAQNAKGRLKSDYSGPDISKGSTRIITDDKKNMKGVIHHPYSTTGHVAVQ